MNERQVPGSPEGTANVWVWVFGTSERLDEWQLSSGALSETCLSSIGPIAEMGLSHHCCRAVYRCDDHRAQCQEPLGAVICSRLSHRAQLRVGRNGNVVLSGNAAVLAMVEAVAHPMRNIACTDRPIAMPAKDVALTNSVELLPLKPCGITIHVAWTGHRAQALCIVHASLLTSTPYAALRGAGAVVFRHYSTS